MELSYNFVNEGLPEFVGENPFGWIIDAELFFLREKIHSTDKMQWAFMRMEGEAMLWFQSWCLENLDADWETFTIALMERFRSQKKTLMLGNPGTEFRVLTTTPDKENEESKSHSPSENPNNHEFKDQREEVKISDVGGLGNLFDQEHTPALKYGNPQLGVTGEQKTQNLFAHLPVLQPPHTTPPSLVPPLKLLDDYLRVVSPPPLPPLDASLRVEPPPQPRATIKSEPTAKGSSSAKSKYVHTTQRSDIMMLVGNILKKERKQRTIEIRKLTQRETLRKVDVHNFVDSAISLIKLQRLAWDGSKFAKLWSMHIWAEFPLPKPPDNNLLFETSSSKSQWDPGGKSYMGGRSRFKVSSS